MTRSTAKLKTIGRASGEAILTEPAGEIKAMFRKCLLRAVGPHCSRGERENKRFRPLGPRFVPNFKTGKFKIAVC